jgi:hypothetical protein
MVSLSTGWAPPAASGAIPQRRFASLEEAAQALVDTFKSGDQKAMLAILGDEGKGVVSSGDEVADRAARARFVAAYDEKHRLEAGGGKVVLVVGSADFPFPIPIVPDGPSWRFDTAAGKEEIVNRRIGRNELNTIQVCLAYVDAQREYYARDPNGDALLQYAQTFASSPGKRDGLYWPTNPGRAAQPARAVRREGEGRGLFQALAGPCCLLGLLLPDPDRPGKDAPGGAYDYLAHGHLMGGFALVAYPARYGVSGVMTFIVNQDGVVYQKDLGPNSAAIARAMTQFNPDSTWQKV